MAYSYGELVAPLYGDRGENRLVYVHPMPTPYPNVRTAGDASSYAAALRDGGAQYLFAATPRWASGPFAAAEWARADSVDFELLLESGTDAAVYRVASGGAPSARESFPFPIEIVLSGLNDPALWKLEFTAGATLETAAAHGGIALAWSFQTEKNDYAELAARPGSMDLGGHDALRFRLAGGLPRGVLFVYLKQGDESRQMRFRIPLSEIPPGGRDVTLAFDRPEHRTDEFDLRHVESIHLVVDDEPDADRGDGSLTIGAFRLVDLR